MDLRRVARSFRVRHARRDAPWLLGLRLAFLAIAGTFVLYLLAANVILRTHLLRGWLDAHPEKLFVEYRSAWSLYPGHVVVRDLAIRHQDANIQLQLELDRGTLHLSLWSLAKRTLLVDRLDAQGCTFRLAHKSVSPEGNEGRISAFPHIEGFTAPFVAEPAGGEDHRWTIEVDDITATLREVWTMEYRYRGDASVTGAFRVRPQHEIYVAPSVMITHGGLLSLGERELIRGGEGRVEATIDRFDPSVLQGIDIVRQLSGSVQQTGELASLASVADTYFPGRIVHLDQGTGPIEIATRLDHGVFQPGGRVTYRSSNAAVEVDGVTVAGDLATVTTVAGVAVHPTIETEATLAQGTAFPTAATAASQALALRDVRAAVTFDNADIVRIRETKIARATTSVKSAHAADLRAWQPIAPSGWTFEGGALTLAGTSTYDGKALGGHLEAKLSEAAIAVSTFGMKASGTVASDIASQDVAETLGFPGVRVDLRDIAVRLASGHSEGLWLRARTRLLRVGTGDGTADADIGVDSGPGARTVELFSRLAHVPDVAAEATSGTELHARLQFRLRPHDVSLTVDEAKNGALEGRGRIRHTPAGTRGAFLVSVGPFHAGLELAGDGVSVRPLASGDWLDEKLRQR